jgi:hypothetical protein
MTDHGDMHFCISLFLLLEALGFELVLPGRGSTPWTTPPMLSYTLTLGWLHACIQSSDLLKHACELCNSLCTLGSPKRRQGEKDQEPTLTEINWKQ